VSQASPPTNDVRTPSNLLNALVTALPCHPHFSLQHVVEGRAAFIKVNSPVSQAAALQLIWSAVLPRIMYADFTYVSAGGCVLLASVLQAAKVDPAQLHSQPLQSLGDHYLSKLYRTRGLQQRSAAGYA
jgi:hypothetical protein